MPKLSPIKRREFIQRLRAFGFEGPFSGGKHDCMRRGSDGFKVTIPNQHAGDISPILQKIICKQAEIDILEWIER